VALFVRSSEVHQRRQLRGLILGLVHPPAVRRGTCSGPVRPIWVLPSTCCNSAGPNTGRPDRPVRIPLSTCWSQCRLMLGIDHGL
jgi:hypothetical protein